MVDNYKEFNVTCYVTVAITTHGIKARDARHAAIDAGLAVHAGLEYGDLLSVNAECIELAPELREVTIEFDGNGIDAYLVQPITDDDAEPGARFDKGFVKKEE